jgi:hypothetical protein
MLGDRTPTSAGSKAARASDCLLAGQNGAHRSRQKPECTAPRCRVQAVKAPGPRKAGETGGRIGRFCPPKPSSSPLAWSGGGTMGPRKVGESRGSGGPVLEPS